MLYTTKQIAQVAQVSQRWVQVIAKLPKYGRDYLAHQMQMIEILKELHGDKND